MNNYELILFDLDGTLTDSQTGIINSISHALDRLGFPPRERHELIPFIGPPLLDSFRKLCGLNERQAHQAVALYREHYSREGIYEATVYRGIPEMLRLLDYHRKKMAVATSKPTCFAIRVLRYYGLDHYFPLIVGSNLDGTRVDKSEVIACALQEADKTVEAGTFAAMVGDRKYDVLGARANGISPVAVTYGFGTREELKAAGPDYLVSSVSELTAVLLGENS